MENMIEFEEIKSKLKKACETLSERDLELLQRDVNERSVTHKLAEYLQKHFETEPYIYTVDCEYNRKDDVPKRYSRSLTADITWDDKDGKTIFPDIIVHKRGVKHNVLVIEVKKTSNSVGKDFDEEKLRFFTRPDGEYHYKFGVYLEYDKTGFCKSDWYMEGEKVSVDYSGPNCQDRKIG